MRRGETPGSVNILCARRRERIKKMKGCFTLMDLRRIEQRKKRECARTTIGFGDGICFDEGLVVGSDGLSALTSQSSAGVVIPWNGSPHVKIMLGSE